MGDPKMGYNIGIERIQRKLYRIVSKTYKYIKKKLVTTNICHIFWVYKINVVTVVILVMSLVKKNGVCFA